jgi:hypothetical protein
MMVTWAAVDISDDAIKTSAGIASFMILVIKDYEIVARFPYMSTLEHAKNEAKRLLDCFVEGHSIILGAHWETEKV